MFLISVFSCFPVFQFSSVSFFKHSFDPVFKYSSFLFPNVSVFKFLLFSDVPVFQHFCVFVSDQPVCRCSSIPVFLFQMLLFSDVPVFQCSCFSVPVV